MPGTWYLCTRVSWCLQRQQRFCYLFYLWGTWDLLNLVLDACDGRTQGTPSLSTPILSPFLLHCPWPGGCQGFPEAASSWNPSRTWRVNLFSSEILKITRGSPSLSISQDFRAGCGESGQESLGHFPRSFCFFPPISQLPGDGTCSVFTSSALALIRV